MIIMNEESTASSYKPREEPFWSMTQYASITILLTPFLAYLLAILDIIPFDPIFATFSGLGVAIVYVAYRWYYAKRYRRDERALHGEEANL